MIRHDDRHALRHAAAKDAAKDELQLADLPLAAAIIDRDGVPIRSNARFRLDFEGLSDLPLQATIAPADRAPFSAAHMAALLNPGSVHHVEMRLVMADGAVREALAALIALPSQGGLTAGTLLQLVDLDPYRQRIAELEKWERRWDAALVGSLSGVWDVNLAPGEWYYSPTWRTIRGLGPEDEIPPDVETWLEVIHPDDRERVLHCVERQYAGDPDYMIFEYRERHKQGHWIWIECRGSCVEWDAHGRPLRVIGTDTDISNRKRSEEALARMQRRLKLALDVSRIGVFEADFDTGASDWDEGMRTIFGVEGQAEVRIGGLWESMLHPEDAQRVFDKVNHHVENLLPFSDEYRITLPDGNERYIRSRTMPFIDADGHRKMIGANWDVTADLALHRELERAKTLAEARNRELESAKARIEQIALHDHLTELPNRRYLDEMLDSFAEECARGESGLAILHIDLDRFKQINDTLGHAAGDMMLRHAATILRSTVRSGDFVARIGGDEFVFLARFDGSLKKLADLANGIIGAMRKPVFYEGHEIRFGASIGIAHERGRHVDPRRVLLNADIALYHAKNSGRNRHEFFSRQTHEKMIASKRLSDDLLRALERDEFVPFYQFQFAAASLDIAGVETLVRWRHPRHGLLSPDKFLALAEEIDVLAEIDGLLLEKALKDFERWRTQGFHVPRLSVNVSSRRLHDPTLARKLSGLSFEPGTLSFELLESIFLDEYDDHVMKNLDHLRRMGIHIEIDDFGTGHASIVSLLRLNPDALKIDRQLVSDLPRSAEQRKLVGAIIDIGHSLNIAVVAEGVETREHIAVLRELGCDRLQGHGLSKAMDFDAAVGFIQAEAWRNIGRTS